MGLTNQRKTPITHNCAYCKQPFKIETFQTRLCCTRSCSAKYKLLQQGKRLPWTQPELDLLEAIAGTVPRHEIAAKYNRRAAMSKLPKRSENAVIVKLKRIGQSQKTIEDNWRMSTLADLLDISRDRVRTWVYGSSRNGKRTGGKLPHRKLSNMTLISKKDFLKFAHQYSEKLAGIHPSNLSFVLEDEELVYKILTLGRPTCGHNHRIVRVETGEKFVSAREAGRSLYLDPKHVLRQTRQGKKAYGMEFKIVAVEGSNDYSHLIKQFMPDSVVKQKAKEFAEQGLELAAIARKLEIKPRKVRYLLSRCTG